MNIKVMKFGGTSVATPEARMQAALRVISAKDQGFSPVVVVSAIGRRGQPYATDTLLDILREIDPTVKPDAREVDLMIACGEIFSSVIFAHTLKSLGCDAMAFRGGQAGIRTDGVYGNARIVSINPIALRRAAENGFVPVVCGFQGTFAVDPSYPGGEVTTLGRGGSDTTGAALGAALKASAVEIFTDVEGVKTADPDYVSTAPTLKQVSYDEVAEIAHLGAKVLHPRAAEIAMKYGIPLWVKSTFSQARGTEIIDESQLEARMVSGVSHTGKLVSLEFNIGLAETEDQVALAAILYDLMARYNLNLHMINQSQMSIGFAVPRAQYGMAKDLLDGLVLPMTEHSGMTYMFQMGEKPSREAETQQRLFGGAGKVRTIGIRMNEACTMVSLIGKAIMEQPGTFFRVLAALHREGVPVLQTSDSDLSLSCLIPESELSRAVLALHEEFELSQLIG